MKAKPLSSVSALRKLFEYSPRLGVLIWKWRKDKKLNWNRRFAGKVAGRKNGSAGSTVTIDGKIFQVHRIVYKMLHGKEPPIVDHKNRNRADNRPRNLRAANKRLNAVNSKDRDRKLPRGVFRCPSSKINPYRAQIKNRHLGMFPTVKDASVAFKKASKQSYGEFSCRTL
jgi:hypothetical protein